MGNDIMTMPFAAVVLVETPKGIPLVYDADLRIWKLPGGKDEKGEKDPIEVGLRELQEETGVVAHPHKAKCVVEEDKDDHIWCLIRVQEGCSANAKKVDDKGRPVGFISKGELQNICNFSHSHREALVKIGFLHA